MAENLTFDILAVDKASEVFKKVGDQATEAGDKMGKIGAAVGKAMAFGFAAVVSGAALIAKVGISEYKENQNAVAQLGAVIKSTSGTAGVTTSQMEKLADTIQNYSGQTHESVEASESLLLGFGNIKDAAGANNDILTRATAITADMAARMGGSASDNAIKLGKALSNPTAGLTSLTRVGVTFTAAQKAQIKAMQDSGNMAGAQNVILAALQTRFGGAAAAAGQTLTGSLARAKEAFEDVSASIVSKLIPGITNVVDWVMTKVIPAMQQLWATDGPKVEAMFSRIGEILTTDVAPILVKVGGFIKDHATLFKALGVALAAGAVTIEVVVTAMKAWAAIQAILDSELLANPIGLVIVALAALAAGLIYAYEHSETFRDIVQGVMKDVSKAFDDVMAVVSTVFDFITKHWQIIAAVVFGPFGLAIDVIHDKWKTIIDIVKDVWGVIEPILKDMVKAIGPVVDAVGKVAGAAGKVGGIVGKGAKMLGFDQGGVVPGPVGRAMAAVVHGGEMVLPADALTNTISPPRLPNATGASGAGGDIYITMTLDSNVFGQAVVKGAQRNQRRTGQSISIPVGVTG